MTPDRSSTSASDSENPTARPAIDVLLVEDHPAHAELVRRAFESGSLDVRLTHVSTLGAARERLAESVPDLTIVDVLLPDGKGTDLLPTDPEERPHPVIILTADGDERVGVEALRAGAVDYVVKSEETLKGMPRIAERALRDWDNVVHRRYAEREFRDLLESAPDAMVVIDSRGRIVRVNAQTERLFGYPRGEILGQPVELLLPERHREKHVGLRQRFCEDTRTRPMGAGLDLCALGRDGVEFPVEVSLSSVVTPDGRYAVAAVRDSSDHIRLRDELHESRRAVETLMANLPGMAYRCRNDRDWAMEFCSDGCLELTGYSASELVQGEFDFARLIHADDREQVWNDVQAAVRDRAPFRLTYRLIARNGREKWVWEQGRGVYDTSGALVALEGFITDITERKQAERAAHTRASQQAAVADLGRLALGGEDVFHLMKKAARDVVENLGVEYCKILETLPGGDKMLLRVGVGWMEGLEGHATVDTGLDSQAGYALRSDEPVIVEDLRKERRFRGPRLLIDHHVVSGMSVVIQGDHGQWGVLGAHTARRATFTVDDVNYLQSVANVLSDAIVRERAEAENTRLAAALESAGEAVLITDPEGVIQYVNPAFVKITGYLPEEIEGKKPRVLKSDEHPREFFEGMWNTIRRRKIWTGEVRNRRKDGSLYDAYLTISPVIDHQGALTGFVGIQRDITEQKRSVTAIRESEERYRAVVEDTPVLICRFLPGGEITYVNEAYCRFFEKSADELVGRTFLSLIPEADRETVMANISALTVDSPTQSHEHQVSAPGGECSWQRWTNRAMFDAEGKAVAYQSIGEDITDRKRVEEAIKEKEKQLDNLLSNVGVIVLEGDPFDFYYVGGQVERILGYRKELWFEHPGGPIGFWSNHLHPDDVDKIEICRNAIALGKDHAFEYRMIAADGRAVWFYDTVTVETENGIPVKTRSVMVDITERKRVEAEWRKSEERVRLMMQQSPSVIEVYDVHGLQVDVNKAYEDLWGFPADHTVNRFNVLESQQVEATGLMEYVKRAYAGEAVSVPEYEFDSRGETEGRGKGRIRWLNTRIYPLKDSEGTVHHIVIAHEDITDRKRAEAERMELEDQLRQSQKLEAIGRLAGGVAHDFNNILTTILVNVELSLNALKNGAHDHSRVIDELREVEKAALRASALTRQLLVFSRRDIVRPEGIDLNHSLANMEPMLRRLISEDISIELACDAKLKWIRADAVQLEQIVMNLVVNARDAMPDGGAITLRTRNIVLDEGHAFTNTEVAAGEYVMLSVHDTGCGMDPDTAERVFEPFFTTKPVGRGTGLGLAMVYAIVKRSKGHVRVTTAPGQGTTLEVYLPAIEPQDRATRPAPADDPAPGGAETVLVCEDDDTVRRLAIHALEDAGYRVVAAECGSDAIQRARELDRPIDLLLTDVIMPGLDGKALAATLTTTTPELKTLFTSGYASDVLARHGMLDEGVELLEKPFSRKNLLRRVRDVLDRPHCPRA